jgi:predicted transposase YbfD/YdcC
LPHGIPGKDVFRRVLMTLKPEAFEAAFNAWIARLRDDATAETGVQRPIISFDGKAARRSHDARNELGPLHVVTAWAGGYGLALGQQVCEEKSNEITAIPELLRKVDVRDGIVTIDAMGAQKAIAEEVVRGKADYVLALRGNQESMHHAVIAYIDDQLEGELEGAEELTTADRGHGREEERTYLQLPAPGSLPGRGEWKGLKSIGVVTSRRLKGDRERLETRYYLSSLPVDVALFARAVRGHWSVEDACHWTLDVTFREDDSRVRERVLGSNIAWLYRFTLSILKQHPDRRMSLIMKRRACGWSGEFLMEAIAALTCYCAPALTGGNLLHGLHPTQQGLLEGRRVEPGQHATEGVLGGDVEVEEAGQTGPAVGAELVDGGEGIGPGEDAADGDEGDVDQRMLAGPLDLGSVRSRKWSWKVVCWSLGMIESIVRVGDECIGRNRTGNNWQCIVMLHALTDGQEMLSRSNVER